MKYFLAVCATLCLAALASLARGQGSAPATLRATPESSPSATPKAVKVSPDKNATDKPKPAASPGPATEQIVTEIYADKAVFESTKSIGVFTGHIIVIDPRFQIQGDKLTIYLSNKQSEGGLDKAVVEGNVGVVREQPSENGAPPTRSIGRADTAIYTTSDGNVELRGSPRVQSGMNTHVATSPDTVMIISQDSKLTTRGPSRTEIRQPPKSESTPTPSSTPKP